MNDFLERLRTGDSAYPHLLCEQAAAEIERLRAVADQRRDELDSMRVEVERLRESLRHNAESHESLAVLLGHGTRITTQGFVMAVCQCEKYAAEARAALNPPRREE